MADTVGLGIIGCGQIAPHHIRNSQSDPRVRWTAVCDVRPEAVEAIADEFDIAGRYTNVDALLADKGVDAVVVATSPVAHAGPTIAALKAGKHVLVEKPVATSVSEAEAMLAAQSDGLVAACCSSRFRSTDGARIATEFLAAGSLGPVRRLYASVAGPPPKDYDGTSPFYLHRPGWGGQGVLADWGCYDLDYLFGLCSWSLEPTCVLADMRRVPAVFRAIQAPANDVEVSVGALAKLTGDAVLDYRRWTFAPVEERLGQWLIECEDGALDLNMLPGSPQVTVRRLTRDGVVTEPIADGPYTWSEIHGGPIIDLVQCILDGSEPRTSLKHALVIQRLTDAMYASARTGQSVCVG